MNSTKELHHLPLTISPKHLIAGGAKDRCILRTSDKLDEKTEYKQCKDQRFVNNGPGYHPDEKSYACIKSMLLLW
jgi:hypothetical protein